MRVGACQNSHNENRAHGPQGTATARDDAVDKVALTANAVEESDELLDQGARPSDLAQSFRWWAQIGRHAYSKGRLERSHNVLNNREASRKHQHVVVAIRYDRANLRHVFCDRNSRVGQREPKAVTWDNILCHLQVGATRVASGYTVVRCEAQSSTSCGQRDKA